MKSQFQCDYAMCYMSEKVQYKATRVEGLYTLCSLWVAHSLHLDRSG